MESIAVYARGALAACLLATTWVTVAHAQQSAQPKQVGILFPGQLGTERLELIKVGLSRSHGTALTVTVREARGEAGKLKPLAEELVKARVDAILAIGSPSLQAAYTAAPTIPIIALDLETDPVKSGMAASLSRPGGTVTGIFFDAPEIAGKWLQLLRDLVPELSRVGLLYDQNTDDAQMRAAEDAAPSFALRTVRLPVSSPDETYGMIKRAAEDGIEALLVHSSPILVDQAKTISEAALKHKLPAIGLFPINARTGLLLAYGPDNFALMPQVGEITGKVLGGAKPAVMPIERPTLFKLIINTTTAKELGVKVPTSMLLLADEIAE